MNETVAPVRHYATTDARPDYTPCGQWADDVMTTYLWPRVTCRDCKAENARAEAATR